MTIRLPLGLAMLLLAGLLGAQAAWAQHFWEALGSTDDGDFDIDISSVKKINEAVVSVATRHVYTPKIAAQQMKSYRLASRPRYGVTDVLVNCGRKAVATTEEKLYDKNDRTLLALRADRVEWETINQGSIMEAIANAVCGGEGEGQADQARGAVSGTGFVVSAIGYVVTNNHVVAGKKKITTVIDGTTRELALLRSDTVNDMALLRLSEAPPQGVAFREGKLIRAGEPVVVLGYPLHGVLANEPNVTTGIVSAQSGPDNDSRLLQFTAPVQQGNSGGPLLDDCGNCVGMVVGKLDAMQLAKATGDIPQNVNFAIHRSMVVNFLRINGVEPVAGSCQQKLSPSETAEKLRGSVLQIMAE
jgi:S1-C subfamily serine protease